MTDTKKCEFCDKRGLPLLLVRHAVAPHGAGAPLGATLDIELPGGVAHYTKRVLRSGYVYVYDEARKRWEAYFVTADGYYAKFLMTPGTTPVVPAKPFNCPDQGHRAVASCIMVPDPRRATNLWIGFSEVLWTDRVRQANESAAYRNRHMTRVNVPALLAGGADPLAQSMSQLGAVVAEYALNDARGRAAFAWNSYAFAGRHAHARQLVQECERVYPGKARIVTIMDPSSIAQELAMLMKHNAETFMARPGYTRNLAANAAIDEIEQAVKIQAQKDEITAAQKLADQQISSNPLGHWLSESTRARTEAIRDVTAAEATRASSQGWEKYARKFDDSARQTWMRSYKTALADYDGKSIAPLARCHAAWMKNGLLASYFHCNYDDAHIDSGLVYTFVMTRCIASTQDKGICSKLYDDWLAGTIDDENNLLLRAMVFNQQSIVNAVKSATNVSIDLRQIPWDNIFATYTNSVERVTENVQSTSARFIVEFAGPVARMFGKIVDGSAGFRHAVMATGIIAGQPVVLCEVVGGRKAFRAHIIRQLYRASGQVLSEHQMARAVAEELRRQGIHGAPMEGSTRKKWLILADKEMIAAMPNGLSPQQRAQWLARSIRTVEQVEALNLARWRSVISSKVRFGVVAGILQAASLTKVIADQEKALANEKNDASLRMYAGITTLAATTSEAFGTALAARAAQGLRFGQGFWTATGTRMAGAGARVGVLTGLFVAGLDGYKAFTEAREGADGLVVASYAASALVGVGLSVALACAALLGAMAIPVIGILVALLIGIGILIEFIKDNTVQDWLERCPWGVLKDQRYPDMETEQAQLKQALS